MNNQLKYKLLLSLWSLSGLVVVAQNAVNQDVKVVRDYAPTVPDANKIELMPALDDTSSYHPIFNYSILSRPFETNKGIEPISPARIADDRGAVLKNSQVKAGLGNYNSLMAQLNYNVLRSTDYALSLELKHATSMGEVELEDGATAEAPLHDTYAGLKFKRFFKESTLSSNITYNHNVFNYYGFQTVQPELDYLHPIDASLVKGSSLTPEENQRFSHFVADLGLRNNSTDKDRTQWIGNFAFGSFGNKTGVHQNKVDLTGEISTSLNLFKLKVDGGLSTFGVKTPDNGMPTFYFTNSSRTIISATPRAVFEMDDATIEAGMLLVGELGGANDQFRLAPHVTAQLNIAEGVATLFGGFKGKYNANDYASIVNENAFVSPDVNVKSSFYGFDFHAGLKGRFSSVTAFTAQVNYALFNDEHFYVNRIYARPTNSGIDSVEYVNMFDVVYDDGSVLKVAGDLNITPNDDLNIRLNAVFYNWQLEQNEKAWHKPDMEFGASANFHVNSDLAFQSSLTFLGNRYASVPELATPKTLKGYFDFNVGATYELAHQWMLWARVNNVTAGNYYRWNGYPSYRFNAMVGVIYSF